MIDEIKLNLKNLENRKQPINDDNIIQKHYFDVRKESVDYEFRSILEQF